MRFARAVIFTTAFSLFAVAASAAAPKVGSAKGKIDGPAPQVMKPKPGEVPTLEVEGVRFYARFGSAGESGGYPKFSTGGVFANGGKAQASARVCISFLDAEGNILYAETLDQSEMQPKFETTACPLRTIPADTRKMIVKYQVTMQVSDKRILG